MQDPSFPAWWRAPFLRWLSALLLGIYAGPFFPMPFNLSLIAWLFILMATLVWQQLPTPFKIRTHALPGALLWLAVGLTGIGLWPLRSFSHQENYAGQYPSGLYRITCTITGAPIQTATHNQKWLAKWEAIEVASEWKSCSGYFWIYHQASKGPLDLPIRARLLVQTRLHQILPTHNPGSFEYADYAKHQGISHTAWIDHADIEVLEKSSNSVPHLLDAVHAAIQATLLQYIPDQQLAHFSLALLLGNKQWLDESITDSYMRTGLMHVIAISGMHLNLIFWLIQTLGSLCWKSKRARNLVSFCSIPLLWLFTLLTGAGASIVRAAFMCSLMIIGNGWRQQKEFLNTWCAACFVLLCWRPDWAYDAGFILSFGALLSLFLFQPMIQNIYLTTHPILRPCWLLCAACLAAQIITLPYSIYLFHQFPLYFLPANLWAVPLSSIVLILLIALVVVSPLPILARLMGAIINELLRWMNHGIDGIANWPFAVWQPIMIGLIQMLLGTAIGFCVYAWHQERKMAWGGVIGGLVILMIWIHINQIEQVEKRSIVWIPYSLKHPAILLIQRQQAAIWYDSLLATDRYFTEQVILPAARHYRVKKIERVYTHPNRDVQMKIGNLSVFWSQSNTPIESIPPGSLILLSRQTTYWPLNRLLAVKPTQVIIDGSNKPYLIEKWAIESQKIPLPIHVISLQGAFVDSLP
jgi:competence protein ComEC